MKRLLAALLTCASFGLVAQEHECPDDATSCSFVIQYSTGSTTPPGPEPPVELPEPPEIPPEGNDSRAHWEEQCARPDVLACATYDSVEDVIAAGNIRRHEETGAGGPNYPHTNRNCRWNGGERNCHPVFEEGNCDVLRELWPRYSQAVTGNRDEDIRRASYRSPCYHEEGRAAVLVDAIDLDGGNAPHLGRHNFAEAVTVVWLWEEYELLLDDSMWRTRKGSDTMKLGRMQRGKDTCTDKRLIDDRLPLVTPEEVQLGFVGYCGWGGYPPEHMTLSLTPDMAGKWIRVERELDERTDPPEVRVRYFDSASGELLKSGVLQAAPTGKMVLGQSTWVLHSTSGQACTGPVDCANYSDGVLAVRHMVWRGEVVPD